MSASTNKESKNSSGSSTPQHQEGRWARWGRAGFDKSIKVSDWISPYANAISAKVGGERFWPSSNDMPIEIEKCERILRAFTVEGIQQKEEKEEKVQDGKGNWIKKKVRVLRKIPPLAIRNAKGIAIYSSMRSGIAPLGGGGGSGLFLARLPDGSWSAPTAISPQSGAVGLLLGIDFLDVVLLINSEKTLKTFMSHRVDLGAETGLTAGPYGSGYSAEASYDRAPVYSYVRNRGAYAGVELLGQVFLHRFDENERFYYWPGIGAKDILTGKVRVPPAVYSLHRALRDAETGRAQGGKLERTEFDIIKIPESEVMKQLGPNYARSRKRFVASGTTSGISTPRTEKTTGSADPEGEAKEELVDITEAVNKAQAEQDGVDVSRSDYGEEPNEEGEEEEEMVQEGERLRLPPTPAELEIMEAAGIPDEEDLKMEKEDRLKAYMLPAPPMHADVRRYWGIRPELSLKRPTEQLKLDGPHSAEVREAQYVKLPLSPVDAEGEEAEQLPQLVVSQASHDFKPAAGPSEEEVMLRGVDEEEANKVMDAAQEGEDIDAQKVQSIIQNTSKIHAGEEERDIHEKEHSVHSPEDGDHEPLSAAHTDYNSNKGTIDTPLSTYEGPTFESGSPLMDKSSNHDGSGNEKDDGEEAASETGKDSQDAHASMSAELESKGSVENFASLEGSPSSETAKELPKPRHDDDNDNDSLPEVAPEGIEPSPSFESTIDDHPDNEEQEGDATLAPPSSDSKRGESGSDDGGSGNATPTPSEDAKPAFKRPPRRQRPPKKR